MNGRIVWAIARKDLREVVGNKAVWLPAILVPVLFVFLLPTVGIYLPTHLPPEQTNQLSPKVMANLLAAAPADLARLIKHLPPNQGMALLMTGFTMAPMFLIIPLMLSSIIGANAWVGEKERKTLEALLYTPATDVELMLGKLLTALIPAVVIAWVSFAAYGVLVNALAWPFVHRIWFPPATWWPLMFWVAPAMATLGLGFTVVVSAKSNTYMEASQMSGFPVLLIMGLIIAQITGVMVLGVGATIALGLLIWLIDLVLLRMTRRTVERGALSKRL